MLPKVIAACEFARATGRLAVIGQLADIEGLVAGTAGTRIATEFVGVRTEPPQPSNAADDAEGGLTMALGVYSEVGRLRKVMVHRPGLEHTRLTPSNAEELLFDDVLWVAQAKREHDAFCEAMRERGVEVFEAETLLSEALGGAETRGVGRQPRPRTSARWGSAAPSGPATGSPRPRPRTSPSS